MANTLREYALGIKFNRGKELYDKFNDDFIYADQYTDDQYDSMLALPGIIPVPCLTQLDRDLISQHFVEEFVLKHYGRDPSIKKIFKKICGKNPGEYNIRRFAEETNFEKELSSYITNYLMPQAARWCEENGIPYIED